MRCPGERPDADAREESEPEGVLDSAKKPPPNVLVAREDQCGLRDPLHILELRSKALEVLQVVAYGASCRLERFVRTGPSFAQVLDRFERAPKDLAIGGDRLSYVVVLSALRQSREGYRLGGQDIDEAPDSECDPAQGNGASEDRDGEPGSRECTQIGELAPGKQGGGYRSKSRREPFGGLADYRRWSMLGGILGLAKLQDHINAEVIREILRDAKVVQVDSVRDLDRK